LAEHLDRDRPAEPAIPTPVRDRESSGSDFLVHLEATTQDLGGRVPCLAGVRALDVRAIPGLVSRWPAFNRRRGLGHV